MARKKDSTAAGFVQIQGRWRFEGSKATYLGPDERGSPVGVCLSPSRFRTGLVKVRATINDPKAAARVVLGYNAATGSYYSVGLGGYDFAYVSDLFAEGRGWSALQARGAVSQLVTGKPYDVEVELRGQRVGLTIDGVRVLDDTFPSPLQGDQAGVFAWGTKEVLFEGFYISGSEPQVFVVMQFGEPYDSLYKEVVRPVCSKLGFKAFRANDVFRPGVILQDIRRGIVEADVIIAEITPANPNVFYELGYAHALDKPTILLANRHTEKLPFDISGYRVIFYDDTIRGKRDIEATLEQHLDSIRKGRSVV